MAQVQILLSTWNGAPWLDELLESLLQQTESSWELLIRDDASTDDSITHVVAWQKRYPHKVKLLEAGSRLGCAASFSRLVELSTAPYLMFCDQDDVWFAEKVELSLARLQALEVEQGSATPLLVHSDLTVLNENKSLIAPSFWALRDFDVHQAKKDYLVTNVVSGCACMFNRAAANLAFPLPQGAILHDRWLALVCAWFGKVEALDLSLIGYRQHDRNTVGASVPVGRLAIAERINAWSRQAESFLECFGKQLSRADYHQIQALANLQYECAWQRRHHILKYRFFKSGIAANLALMLFA